MAINIKHPTRPIESLRRTKELADLYVRESSEAPRRGDTAVFGGFEEFFEGFLAGMGTYVNVSRGYYYDVMMRDKEKATRILEALEARGYARDICSIMRCHLSRILAGFADRDLKGDPIKLDFMFFIMMCKTHGTTARVASKQLGIPSYLIDHPNADTPGNRQYLLEQFLDAIERAEKTTGKRFRDNVLLEAVPIEWDTSVVWAKIVELNKAVPAPLDVGQLRSLRAPVTMMRYRRETLDYVKELYDEVKDRVANGISAHGFEERRLTHEGIPPAFFTDRLLDLPEEYGAIFVLSDILTCFNGAWRELDNGSMVPAPGFQESGWKIKTREDALKAEIDLYLSYYETCTPMMHGQLNRPRQALMRALDWHADGVVFHQDRCCHMDNAGIIERKTAVQQAGIPTVSYEGSARDPRELDESEVVDRLDSFLESLGLKRRHAAPSEQPSDPNAGAFSRLQMGWCP